LRGDNETLGVIMRTHSTTVRRSLFAAAFALCALYSAQVAAQPATATGTAARETAGDAKSAAEARSAGDSTAKSGAADTAPAKPEAEYQIGSQDLLEVAVFGQPDMARTVRVNTKGKISLPLIGQLDAVGLTAQQLERLIADRLSEKYLQDPQVTVFIKEFTTLRFTVEGAVNKPGVYPLTGQMTLLRALAVAGGQGSLSDVSEVMMFRVDNANKRSTLTFDVEKIRAGQLIDPLVQNDDLIVVRRSKARTALKDSLFRDILDAINPIPLLR
jgi:polysaccharide biosynthesis/export protein